MKILSATAMQAMGDQNTSQEPLVVLTVDHASFASPVRLVDAASNVVHAGDTYQWYPFAVTLPAESKDELPTATIRFAHIDRTIGLALQAITGDPPTVEFSVVLASTPNVVEMGPYHFTLGPVSGDAGMMSAPLAIPAILDEPCPGGQMTPANYPALFER